MKKWKFTIYCTVLATLILWLFFSTAIIVRLSGLSIPRESDFEVAKKSLWGKHVTNGVSGTMIINDFNEAIGVKGFAFVETEHDNPDRFVVLFLVGDNKCYELRDEHPTLRAGLKTLFPDMKIPSNYLQYNFEFTCIEMENGTYDIWIYCWENETDYGLVQIQYQLEKTNESAGIFPWRSRQVGEPIERSSSENSSGYLDSVVFKNERIEFSGWALAEGQDTMTQNVYIELTNEVGERVQYYTQSYTRPSIAEIYQNDLYQDCGYIAYVSPDEIADGKWTVQILVENGGEVWGSNLQYLVKSGDSFELMKKLPAEKLEDLYEVTETVRSISFVDSAILKDRRIEINGWALAEGQNTATQNVYIEFANEVGERVQYYTQSYVRPGIAEIYQNDLYQNCGYTASISSDEIVDGIWTVQTLVENNGMVWGSSQQYLIKSGDSIELISKLPAIKLEDLYEVTETVRSIGFIDSAILKDRRIEINGWALAGGQDTATQNVYIELTNEVGERVQYYTQSYVRPGIAEIYQNDFYQNCGYTASVSSDEIADGVWTVQILVDNGGMVWGSNPVTLTKSRDEVELVR